ncbi:hypothetical protein HanPSC8_Chr01g0032831 [Helianthus annuus]|nr:hypothetical protein HanPSC8_Chr01g0032831 [Helianthus annuus]
MGDFDLDLDLAGTGEALAAANSVAVFIVAARLAACCAFMVCCIKRAC